MLVRAGLVVVLVPVNVSGFRPVLAHGWHGLQEAKVVGVDPEVRRYPAWSIGMLSCAYSG